jgi:hypothetical protein
MTGENTIFEKTYADYVAQLRDMVFETLQDKLGVSLVGQELVIPLFGKLFKVSKEGLSDPSGERPAFDVCIILLKYILLCPDTEPVEKQWASFRDMKDSGPLTVYFSNEVEHAIVNHFEGRLVALKNAGQKLNGYSPDMPLSYDLALQFDILPKIPVLLLFNDGEEVFPAACSVLFEHRAESYLDAECLSMVGRRFFTSLKKLD